MSGNVIVSLPIYKSVIRKEKTNTLIPFIYIDFTPGNPPSYSQSSWSSISSSHGPLSSAGSSSLAILSSLASSP
jgi:hypothetical protein